MSSASDFQITEAMVVDQVKEVLRATGLAVQRINTGAFKVGSRFVRTAGKGTLDFEGYDNHGRFLAFECKRPKGGRVSPEQKARIEDINRKGGIAAVIHSGEEALEIILKNKCI